jgi:hypothetical protein
MANSKDPSYKDYLNVLEEYYEFWAIKRNANWIELDKPYISGYYMYFDLRFDIKNRDDAWVFYECLEVVGNYVWHSNKTFKRKLSKGRYEYIRPGFGAISEDIYRNLKPAVKKYFRVAFPWSKVWNPFRPMYECTVPSYFFVEKIKPRWITHYKEHDELVEQMQAECHDKLYNKYWKWYRHGPHGVKPYAQFHNRSDRRHSKQTIKRNMQAGDFDKYEYRYQHRNSARWECW